MGLRDYDDYNNDDRRGRRGTRKTAVVIAFGILIALIILVVYLIANPDNKIEIAEKKTSESIKSEDKVDSSSQSGKSEKLFNFTTQSSPLTESAEEIKESDVTVDTPSDSSSIVVEEPESEIVEVEVSLEETAGPEENETPVVEGNVYEETPLVEETSEIEIIPQKEDYVEEESTIVEKTMPEEDISLEEEVLALEEITIKEEDAPVDNPVVEENIEEEEVLPVVTEPVDVIEDEIVADDVLIIEEEVYNPFEGVDSSSVVKSSEGVISDGRLIIRGKSGSAVYSLFSGEVVETGRENGLKYVVIRGYDGRGIKYTGFERVNVKNLSIVKESSLLGSIGSSTSNTIILEYIDAE